MDTVDAIQALLAPTALVASSVLLDKLMIAAAPRDCP